VTAATAGRSQLETVRALAGELIARDGWSRDRLLGDRDERLSELLRHAVTASPYYRETLGPDAPQRPLHELPTLSKATLMDQWDRIVTDPRLRLASVEAHASGPAAAERHLDEFRVVSTSGSSGLRGTFVYAAPDWALWIAAHLRAFARLGIGPGTRLAAIGAPGPTHLTRQLFSIFQAGEAPRLSVLTPLDTIVEALNAYRPEAVVGYASLWALLADAQLEGRLRIHPRGALLGAEPLTEDIRRRIGAAWAIEPASVYATTEAPIVAAGDGRHDGLDISDDLLVVEVVDRDNRPVAAGVAGEKVLVTSLANRCQPLIRYELSDRVTLAAGRNPSGRPYARIATVDGRTADALHLPARAGGQVELLPYALAAPFAGLPAVRQYQIVHHPGRLHVRLVLRPDAADVRDRVRGALRDALVAAGAVPPRIDVECVAELEREPGPAAKLKLIKSCTPERMFS
jgi:phenylacetate-coenzyme A ligase PaaK-like adenylate-forming protein